MSIISLTDAAKTYLIGMLENKGVSSVKLDLAPQGCNGYKYTWLPAESNAGDHVVELGGEKYLVFNESIAPHIMNSTVALESNGLLGQQLTLINPNVAGSCGCGESVNFK